MKRVHYLDRHETLTELPMQKTFRHMCVAEQKIYS